MQSCCQLCPLPPAPMAFESSSWFVPTSLRKASRDPKWFALRERNREISFCMVSMSRLVQFQCVTKMTGQLHTKHWWETVEGESSVSEQQLLCLHWNTCVEATSTWVRTAFKGEQRCMDGMKISSASGSYFQKQRLSAHLPGYEGKLPVQTGFGASRPAAPTSATRCARGVWGSGEGTQGYFWQGAALIWVWNKFLSAFQLL